LIKLTKSQHSCLDNHENWHPAGSYLACQQNSCCVQSSYWIPTQYWRKKL